MRVRPVEAIAAVPAPETTTAPALAFEDFYRAEAGRVQRALVVTLGDAHAAREATDEAMARACARWSRVGGFDNPGGWVYRVGLNWATSRWRKLRRERPFVAEAGQAADPPDPAATAALSAVRHLPLEQRAVVVCRVLLDLSTAETARALAIPTGTVKSRLARALGVLRAELGKED